MAAPDLADFLEVMQRRGYLLAELRNGEMTKPELEGALDVSRSTIDRGVRELESEMLIERGENGYRQTLAGKLALREYAAFTRRIAGLYRGTNLLTSMSRDAPFDLAMLKGARIVASERSYPHRPVETLYDRIASATAVREFTPAVHPQQVATYADLADDDAEVELVLTETVVERLLSSYADEFEGAMANGGLTVMQASGDFQYGLTVARTDDGPLAAVMVYTDAGVRGCIVNDDEAAVEWARSRYEVERERATPLG